MIIGIILIIIALVLVAIPMFSNEVSSSTVITEAFLSLLKLIPLAILIYIILKLFF